MKFLQALTENVPPRARIFILLVLLISSFSLYYMYIIFTTPNQRGIEVNGTVDVASMTEEATNIDAPKPDSQIIFPDDQTIPKTVRESEEARIAAAEESGSTFIQTLKIQNAHLVGILDEQEAVELEEQTASEILKQREQEIIQEKINANQAELMAQEFQSKLEQREYISSFLENEKATINNMVTSGYASLNIQDIRTPKSIALNAYSINLPDQDDRQRDIANQNPGEPEVDNYIHIPPGTIFIAEAGEELNSEESDFATATIVEPGALYESVFIGTPVLKGESIHISYNIMSRDGREYPVHVVAVNLDNGSSGLADDVDHHYFERYFKVGVAAFAGKYAESLVSSSTESVGSTLFNSKEAIPDTKSQLKYAGGAALSEFLPEFKAGFNRPPTVTTYAKKYIGIRFLTAIDIPQR